MGLPKRKQFKWNLLNKEIQFHLGIRNNENFIWESSNGKKKLISEMDTNHIKNAISKFERGEYDWTKETFVQPLKMELIYREIINNKKTINSDEKSKPESRYAVSV